MQLDAKRRTEFGKNTKKLRRNRLLPGVIYGKGMDSVPVTIPYNDFVRVFREAGETNIVDINFGDQTEKVLIRDLQIHPVSSEVIHADFYKVNLEEKITAEIPVEIIGDEENELVKSGEAISLLLINEITIEALPTDLIDAFKVDISGLQEIGDGIQISDLMYDKSKIELVGHEDEDLVAKLDYAVTEEEEEEDLSEEELLEKIEVTGESEDSAEEDASEEE